MITLGALLADAPPRNARLGECDDSTRRELVCRSRYGDRRDSACCTTACREAGIPSGAPRRPCRTTLLTPTRAQQSPLRAAGGRRRSDIDVDELEEAAQSYESKSAGVGSERNRLLRRELERRNASIEESSDLPSGEALAADRRFSVNATKRTGRRRTRAVVPRSSDQARRQIRCAVTPEHETGVAALVAVEDVPSVHRVPQSAALSGRGWQGRGGWRDGVPAGSR